MRIWCLLKRRKKEEEEEAAEEEEEGERFAEERVSEEGGRDRRARATACRVLYARGTRAFEIQPSSHPRPWSLLLIFPTAATLKRTGHQMRVPQILFHVDVLEQTDGAY